MLPETIFDITLTSPVESGGTLLVGLPSPGLAGLTALNQLVSQPQADEIGYLSAEGLPAITPFEDGVPRHHTRLYNLQNADITILTGELFIPPWAASAFTTTLREWTTTAEIDEIAILHDIPYPHGPEDHATFYVATEAYQKRRLENVEIDAMGGGVLDGVPGELMRQSLTEAAPPVGVYTTPAHLPGPDIDGALRFLDTLEEVYELAVDRQELEDISATIKQHLETLADRMSAIEESEQSQAELDFYADRMYM